MGLSGWCNITRWKIKEEKKSSMFCCSCHADMFIPNVLLLDSCRYIDYCNSLFYGLPNFLIQRLQHVFKHCSKDSYTLWSLNTSHQSFIFSTGYLLSNKFISNSHLHLSRLFKDKFQTTSETCLSHLRNIDHLDHLDITIACFYLSLILTWFIMEGELLVMHSPGSGITSQ